MAQDFGDDEAFRAWFQTNCWNADPSTWSPERRRRAAYESRLMRREINRRFANASSGPVDEALFWSGVAVSVTGAAVLLFPPAGIAMAIGAAASTAGLGLTAVGAVRRSSKNRYLEQLDERSRDLTRLQERLNELA